MERSRFKSPFWGDEFSSFRSFFLPSRQRRFPGHKFIHVHLPAGGDEYAIKNVKINFISHARNEPVMNASLSIIFNIFPPPIFLIAPVSCVYMQKHRFLTHSSLNNIQFMIACDIIFTWKAPLSSVPSPSSSSQPPRSFP